jgi:hypothetical protein
VSTIYPTTRSDFVIRTSLFYLFILICVSIPC